MKLYTEEQLKFIYNCYDFNLDQDGCHIIDEDTYFKQKIKELKPIELPSDEEIENASNDKINISNDCFGQYDFTSGQKDGFLEGAFWMKEQILNQNK